MDPNLINSIIRCSYNLNKYHLGLLNKHHLGLLNKLAAQKQFVFDSIFSSNFSLLDVLEFINKPNSN